MKKLLPYVGALVYLLVGQVGRAFAQSEDFGADTLNGLVISTGSRDLFDMIVGIVNTVLYFLGGIAILLGLYAGWLWFSSRGNAEQIKKAKGILISAVIGLFIIFASYAITNFVIKNLYRNTIGGTTEIGPGGGGPGLPGVVACPPPTTPGQMVICSYSSPKPVGGSVTIGGWNFGNYDAASSRVSIGGTASALVSCGAGGTYWHQRFVRDDDTYYQVKVIVPELTVGGPYEILVQNTVAGVARQATRTGFMVSAGSAGLNIACIEPDESGRNTTVVAHGINFGTNGANGTIHMLGWNGTAAATMPVTFDPANWSDTQITFDIPTEALASYINIANTDINSGTPDSEYFKVLCTNGCQSTCCSREECRPLNICSGVAEFSGPHISYITPDNAREGNLVTIQGTGFGNIAGSVEFVNNSTGVATSARLPRDLNSNCQNLWTDTDIIVGVPDLPVDQNYSVRLYPNGSTVASNSVAFDINNTNRPGICLASRPSGSLGTPVNITGVSFVSGTGNTVKYGGIPGYEVTINSAPANTAVSNVPNLRNGLVGIQINDGTNVSNPYPFTITEAITGDPTIVNIDPTAGPSGTYLTINGTNFGNSKGSGNVFFGTVPASFDFPLQCSGSIWSSSRILVKVPTTLTADTDYEVSVVRSDTKVSNTKTFTFRLGVAGPGLCAMFPDNGPKNSEVSFYGDNFETVGSQIKFYNNQSTAGGARTLWTRNSALYIPVPNGAETGPVVVTSGGVDSNAFNFRVGSCTPRGNNCNSGETCCQNVLGNYCATNCSNARMCTYGWDFRTVPTPPTPLSVEDRWPACGNSCGNAQIGMKFNVLLDDTSAKDATNYSIEDTAGTFIPITSVTLTENPGADLPAEVVLGYAPGALVVNHTYRVTVSPNLPTDLGVLSEGELEALATPFFWEFTVQQGSCAFTGVDINLIDFTASRPNQSINYKAAPTANVGSCGIQRLTCTSCDYNWSLDNNDVASWSTANGDSVRRALSTNVTIPAAGVSSEVSCRITQDATSVSATTNLFKDYTSYLQSLLLVTRYPECGNACTNAIVGMRFNSQLAVASVTNIASYVHMRDSSGANVVTGVSVPINNPNSESVVEISHIPFVAGETYTVTVDANQIQNVYTNRFAGTSWQFTAGSAECTVTDATVLPPSVNVAINGRNQNVNYAVQTESYTPSCGRIPVYCNNCAYNWSSSLTTVADISGSRTTKNTKATVGATATAGTTEIRCAVTQGAAASFDAVPGRLNTTLTPTSYTTPYVVSYSPQVGENLQCRNMAIEIVFSERMNIESIRNNLKLHNFPTGSDIAGSFSFSNVNVPSGGQGTKVVFLPNEILDAGRDYVIEVNGGLIVSLNNIPLDPASPIFGTWVFSIDAGGAICKISFVRTNPSNDWFTCGGNNCKNDEETTVEGNQHYYSVTAYSRQATPLSSVGLTYRWQASPNTDSVSLTETLSERVTAKAESKNGETRVSVTVTGRIAEESLGSASASVLVNTFLCQNPWPNISNFPWVESSNNLNFSTYYCAQFNEGGPTLPYLLYPPALSRNTDNLGEYIFTVNINTTTSQNNSLGSLAYYLPENKPKDLWQRVGSLMKINEVLGQELTPPPFDAPSDVNARVSGNGVEVSWTYPARHTGTEITNFQVQRKLTSADDDTWASILDLPVDSTVTSYIDHPTESGIYSYRVVAFGGGFEAMSSARSLSVSVSSGNETNFIIIRVMPNAEHLSVQEWYKNKFPGDALGEVMQVDGYEAMQVGNTTYISAANISGTDIYTNIYIIAYSIGANAQTQAIYDQMVENFKLNTNSGFSATQDDNLCTPDSDGNRAVCSSDFDCPVRGQTCFSRSLKLRRDVKRLTDLLPVKKYLDTYGIAHKACSGNSQITCSTDSQCGAVGPCVNYYPQLSAGTFVRGQSNSKWPSWQQTLAGDIRQTLPVDPLNRFSACPDADADPATCWNEAARTFQCSVDSSVYGFILGDNGKRYDLYSNFEYDDIHYGGLTITTNINNGTTSGIAALANIHTDMSYCTDTASLPGDILCGNGRVDGSEECDGGSLDNICRHAPTDPVPGLGLSTHWWNEQSTGCNPPGTPDQCQWYHPTLTADICGGYCRDSRLQSRYETCDVNGTNLLVNGFYHCPRPATSDVYPVVTNVSNCNAACSLVCSDGLPAARCGDGVWTAGREACDATAFPNGLAGWDCTGNGNVLCVPPGGVSGCNMVCDNGGIPYYGRCGDGIVQSVCSNNRSLACTNNADCISPGTCTQVESCDYASYNTPPLPQDADGDPAYTCSPSCNFTGQPYCGDNILQLSYREQCDGTLLNRVLPGESNQLNQYACRMSNDIATNPRYTRCTPTAGGYCGNNNRELAFGELCDGPDYPDRPTAAQSSETRTYECADNCLGSDPEGGYCGDGDTQPLYEACDVGMDIVKKADVVFVFDMSASMESVASGFCNALSDVVTNLRNNDVDFRITIMPLGDSTTTNALSATTNDNINNIFRVNEHNTDNTDCNQYPYYRDTHLPGAVRTFNALVGCSLPAVVAPNSIRFLSFYDTANNGINQTLAPVVATNCTDMNYPASGNCTVNDQYAGNIENWAYATERIARGYGWQSGYQRIIVPVSDEYAWCGGNMPGPLYFTNDDDYGPLVTSGHLYDAARQAIGNDVRVSPVFLATTTPAAVTAAANLASDTGGQLITSSAGWGTNIMRIVNAAFCDGNNDGIMDCTIPGYTPPPPDLISPTDPTLLVATAGDRSVTLSWNLSFDAGSAISYIIERATAIGGPYTEVSTVGSSPYTDSGLTNRTTYFYRVRARDLSGNLSTGYTSASATPISSDVSAPSAPTALSATPSGTQVSLAWTSSVDNIAVTGYNILRSTTNGGSYTQIATSNTNSYTNNGLSSGTTYYYVVQAYDDAGNVSANSNQATAIIDTSAPSNPTALSATPSGTQVALTWTASTDNVAVTGYNILRSTTNGGSYTQITTSNTNSYTNTGVAINTYYYVVQAYDAAGNTSGNSNQATAVMDTNPPTVPNNLQAAPLNTQVALTWNASTDPEGAVISYIIERAPAAAGPFSSIATVSTNSYNNTGLTNGTTYYYRVIARDTSNNSSAPSSVTSAMPDNNTVAPNPPTALNVTADIARNYMNLVWNAPLTGSIVAYYIIERSLSATSGFSQIGTTVLTAFTDQFTLNPPQLATNYYYRVKAVGTLWLESIYSNTDSDMFPDSVAPSIPTAVSATFPSTQVVLTWTASTDNLAVTQYVVQRSTSPTTGFSTIATPNTNAYNDASITLGTTYYYQIAARDNAGNQSAFSSPVASVLARDAIAPSVPGSVVASFNGTEVVLTWTASSDNVGVDHYVVQRSTSPTTGFTTIGTPGANSYNDAAVAPNTTYYYQVLAQDAANNQSAFSSPSTSVITRDTTPPSVPTGFYTEAAGYYTARFRWTASTDNVAVTEYVIERSESPTSGFLPIATSNWWGYDDTFTAADFNKTFYYRVAARDAAGNQSAFFDPPFVHMTLDTIQPTPPTNLVATAGTAQIDLTWTASTDARGINHYNIERSLTPTGTFSPLATSVTNSYTDSSANTGTFYYRIYAVDNSGLGSGSYSNTTSASICDAAYCDLFDSGTGVAPGNWAACSASCSTAPQRCCQACRDSAGNYSGCRLNGSRPNSCPIPTASGVICR